MGFGLVGSLCVLCGRRIRDTGREINKACARGLRGERGTFHSPHALPTPSRPVLVIALHFVFAGYAAYLLGHSPRAKTFFYRQKTEAATAIYSFYGPGANKQLSEAQVVQKLYNAIHWINHYPVDSAIGFPDIFPLNSGR